MHTTHVCLQQAAPRPHYNRTHPHHPQLQWHCSRVRLPVLELHMQRTGARMQADILRLLRGVLHLHPVVVHVQKTVLQLHERGLHVLSERVRTQPPGGTMQPSMLRARRTGARVHSHRLNPHRPTMQPQMQPVSRCLRCSPQDPTTMNKVKAGLRGLNPKDKEQRAAIVYGQLNGNPDFPNPSPSMAEFHAAYLELKAANIAALDRGRMALARRDSAVARMDVYLTRLAGYVNSVCLGDRTKLMYSGFELVKRGTPISSLQAPTSFKVRPTSYPGEVRLSWDPVKGSRMYTIERAIEHANGELEWVRLDETSRSYFTVTGLPSHVPCQFRVYARGTQANSGTAVAFGKAA